jgi:intraflagellar transport protein 172
LLICYLRLAEQRGYDKLKELQEEHMSLLLQTGQYEKVGQVLEKEGKFEQALNMYIKSHKLVRVPSLLLKNSELLSDHTLVATVLKNLIKHEMFEAAAEIYEKLDKPDLAMECYRKGKVWNKAVDLAREVSPDKVVNLEEEWGDSLVESKQLDAAISHYIEAGCTLKALDTAVSAKQWKKAVHIIRVIDDPESVKKYYDAIGGHFASVGDHATAEKLYTSCGMFKEAVDMYNAAGLWEKAHSIASQYLEQEEVADMYIKKAAELEENGKYRDAERLYVSVNSPDLAIAMYKRVEQYDNMVRLVEKYHPDLLETTHLHLGQQLEAQGKYRAAEIHYLAVNEWKAAMNMYRTLGMWEEAYRVAKQNGGATAASQVAFLWARTLPIDSAIKLLNKYGILDSCINYACETYQFEFAFQLCKNLPSKLTEVHYKYAMALEDDGKFQQAESEFILAEKPKEAVLMYTHAKNWINALRIAETYEPASVPEVLQAQAGQCFHDKQFSEFEVLLLRAQMPELIVQKYKSSGESRVVRVETLIEVSRHVGGRFASLQRLPPPSLPDAAVGVRQFPSQQNVGCEHRDAAVEGERVGVGGSAQASHRLFVASQHDDHRALYREKGAVEGRRHGQQIPVRAGGTGHHQSLVPQVGNNSLSVESQR